MITDGNSQHETPARIMAMCDERHAKSSLRLLPTIRDFPFQKQFVGDYIYRFVPLYQLLDLFANNRFVFTVPSKQVDTYDGRSESHLMEARELARGLLGIEIEDMEVFRKHKALKEWTDSIRDTVRISCWTNAGESYAMWKSFSDLETGICIVVDSGEACDWAVRNSLDFGPVVYADLDDVNLALKGRLDCVQSDVTGIDGVPAAWIKDKFFQPESEIRFGKRTAFMPPPGDTLTKLRAEAEQGPLYVPVDPFELLSYRDLSDVGIVVAPKAPCWYIELIRRTVDMFWAQRPPNTKPIRVRQSRAGERLVGYCQDTFNVDHPECFESDSYAEPPNEGVMYDENELS